MQNFKSDIEAADALKQSAAAMRAAIGKVIVGQDDVVEKLIISILCNGHSLLVGVPGLAKTLLVKTIADVLDLSFKRIQFTPDLMPSDIVGAEILNEARQFQFIKGPIFANIILADEINRTPPKTQAALLEAMQERNVTAGGILYKLPAPFFVLATQNPIELEGTYPLPEAQLDRFLFNTVLDYLPADEELKVVDLTTANNQVHLETVTSASEILDFQTLVRMTPVAESVARYTVELVRATRPMENGEAPDFVKKYVNFGASVRAAQFLILAAKTRALIHGRFHVAYEDIRTLAPAVLRHRVLLNFHAESDRITSDEIVRRILEVKTAPRA